MKAKSLKPRYRFNISNLSEAFCFGLSALVFLLSAFWLKAKSHFYYFISIQSFLLWSFCFGLSALVFLLSATCKGCKSSNVNIYSLPMRC
ncbi:MAG: hypothetical protein JSU01_20995 [Bacteroidetes bacterium]|nr:hypothetical protein [Bacteroidota bacterium]